MVFALPVGMDGGPAPGVEDYLADVLLDTTRAALRMITADTLGRFPEVSVFLSLPPRRRALGLPGRPDVDAGVPPERGR